MAVEVFLLVALTIVYFVIPYGTRPGDEDNMPEAAPRGGDSSGRAPAPRERSWKHFYRRKSYG